MNGYLVLVRCGMNNLPFALVADREEAIKIADEFDPATPDDSHRMDDVVRRINLSHPSYVFDIIVVEFIEGCPIKTTYCRRLGNARSLRRRD